MKRKDIIYLILAALILGAAGYLGMSVLAPKSSAKDGVTVEVVTPISSEFNADMISTLKDRNKVIDYYNRPDLTQGLNNSQPFGQ